MAPNTEKVSKDEEVVQLPSPQAAPRKYSIIYPVVFVIAYWHIGALYGLYLAFAEAKWATIVFNLLIYSVTSMGVTAGVHRLWAHRSYKAKLPLQVLLMILQTMSWQKTVFNWVRDHRLHHKYCDTDADPHNSARGFFYSHIGWLMVRKHPETIEKGKTIDMTDLLDNPVLQFQKKYYNILSNLLVFILPALIPLYWQESLITAHYVALLRLLLFSHVVLSINSVAHMFGYKPYDKNISPTQSAVLSCLAFGEGYHNYHHVFPFDYRVSEFGNSKLNLTTNFIDFFAWVGWAYDLKYASDDMIEKKANRTGDGPDLWGCCKPTKEDFTGKRR